MITLEWTDQVVFLEENPICKVETYQVFTAACAIDFKKRSIEIFNVFKGVDQFFSPVSITLDKITNPVTNIGLRPFKLRTYDDMEKKFAVDTLDYTPLTQCNWPCERCGADKDYCYKCWDS